MRPFLFTALLLAGCGGGRVDVDLPELDTPVAFAVTLEDGTPTSVVGPFAIEGGRTTPRALLSVDADRGGLLLLRVAPSAASQRSFGLRIAPPPVPSTVDPSTDEMEGVVPREVDVRALRDDLFESPTEAERAALDALTWSVTMPGLCTTPTTLRPFATAAALLPSAPAFAGDLLRVRRIDDERIVAISAGNLYLFTPADTPDAPRHNEFVPLDGATNVEALDMDVFEREGVVHGLVAATARGCRGDAACVEGRLFEFRIEGTSVVWVGTATVASDGGLRAVAFDDDGTALLAGDGGLLIARDAEGRFSRLSNLVVDDGRRIERLLRENGDVALSSNQVFVGDFGTDVTMRRSIDPSSAVTIQGVGAARGLDGALWVAANPARLVELVDTTFEALKYIVDDALAPCLGPDGSPNEYTDLQRVEDRLVAAIGCTALISIAPRAGCASAIPSGAVAPGTLRAVHSSDGVIVAAGRAGTIYVAD